MCIYIDCVRDSKFEVKMKKQRQNGKCNMEYKRICKQLKIYRFK